MEILTEQKNQSSYSEVISLITGKSNLDKDINNKTLWKLSNSEKKTMWHMWEIKLRKFDFYYM